MFALIFIFTEMWNKKLFKNDIVSKLNEKQQKKSQSNAKIYVL